MSSCTRTIEPFEIKQFLELIKDYNRATKHGKLAPEIDTSNHMLDVTAIYGQMKPDILQYLDRHGVRYELEPEIDRVVGEVDVVYQTRMQKGWMPMPVRNRIP